MTPYPLAMDVPQYMMDALAFLKGDRSTHMRNKLFHDSWEALGFAGGKYFPIGEPLMNKALPFTPFQFNFADKRHLIDTIENHQKNMHGSSFDAENVWNFMMALASKIIMLIMTEK